MSHVPSTLSRQREIPQKFGNALLPKFRVKCESCSTRAVCVIGWANVLKEGSKVLKVSKAGTRAKFLIVL